jgi:pre-mRNA-processing factor 17
MSDQAFRAQHLSHAILGYSQNPSNDPSAPQFVGSLEAAKTNGFNTVDVIRPTNASRRELKRKRKAKGDLEIMDGEGAYVGPWAGWEGENEKPEGLENYEEEVEEEEESEAGNRTDTRKKPSTKRSAFGQETSIFHGKSLTDYQGRTYMYPPLSVAPHLALETSEQECFIPKACVHTFTGHTAGVSVIRLLPKTGHLMLSGSMDKKIKVSLLIFRD